MNAQRSGQIAYYGTLLKDIRSIEGNAAENVMRQIREILGEKKAQKLLDHAKASPNFVLDLLHGNHACEPEVRLTRVMQTSSGCRDYASNLPRSYPISDLPNILENYPDLDDLYKRSIKGLDLLGT
jgi:hypothetical protein